MEKELAKGISDFLRKNGIKKLRKQYRFEAPKSRNDMYRLYRGRPVGRKLIAETLKWAFYNDRRYLGGFLKNLMKNSEKEVLETTREGIKLARQGKPADAVLKLAEIKGVGGVTASKILMFAMPGRFGMYDRFNGKAVYQLKAGAKHYFKKANPNSLTKKQYAEEFEKYTNVLRAIGKRLKMKPADVDMALFRLGRGH